MNQPTFYADQPAADGARQRWRNAATFRFGAEQVTRYRAGLCLRSGCVVKVPRRDLWCDDHVSDSRASALRDMRRVLEGAAGALGV